MKKAIILLAGLMFVASTAWSQNVTVSSAMGQNIASFLNNNFAGGGVYVYNAKFNGMSGTITYPQIGTFLSNGYPNLEMANGIIITTGNVALAGGPNTGNGNSIQVTPYFTDTYLNDFVNSSLTSCATIDFDFVTLSNNISFNYMFASEEYPSYIYTTFNDVFMILLTGPDPVSGEIVTRNIAMIPNTVTDSTPYGIPVSINSVNDGTNPSCEGCYDDFSQYYIANYYDSEAGAQEGVEYNGMTTKLAAAAGVLPCATYHMHITICNVQDQAYDSGSFLESNSFSSPSAQIGFNNTLDTIRSTSSYVVPLTLYGTIYDSAQVTVQFGGEGINGMDFICTADNGAVINNGESFPLNQGIHNIAIDILPSADLGTPKTLDLYFQTSLCPDHPELIIFDTMHFILKHEERQNTGIANIVEEGTVSVFPNPAQGMLNVASAYQIERIEFIAMDGRTITTYMGTGLKNMIDVSKYEPGVYMVRVYTVGGMAVEKVVLK